ncbi:MAG: class I SAM-dependent methyltransferase [Gemmataceae bacterium]
MKAETEADQERREPDYPIVPGAGFHWLTPFYDLLCLPFGLGRRFQRGVADRLALTGGERLLDVGCGTGTLLAEVKRRFPGVVGAGIDPDPAILRIAGRRLARRGYEVDLQVARAEALPFPDAAFDVVVSTLVLHHLPTPAKHLALGEIFRTLRPGGRFLLVDFGARPERKVPWWQRLFENVEHLEDHVQGRLPAFIAQAGLVNVRCIHRRWPAVEYLAAEKP